METPPSGLHSSQIDECLSAVMVYTPAGIVWGEVLIKSAIRASLWLRSHAAPEHIKFSNARFISLTQKNQIKPTVHSELHIHTPQILAYHLVPPNADPIDYDPNDQNQSMIPVFIILNTFFLEGYLWLSIHSNLGKSLELSHDTFLPVYNAKISSPDLPSFGTIAVPHVLIRKEAAIISLISN
jgi:hypothetical protein